MISFNTKVFGGMTAGVSLMTSALAFISVGGYPSTAAVAMAPVALSCFAITMISYGCDIVVETSRRAGEE